MYKRLAVNGDSADCVKNPKPPSYPVQQGATKTAQDGLALEDLTYQPRSRRAIICFVLFLLVLCAWAFGDAGVQMRNLSSHSMSVQELVERGLLRASQLEVNGVSDKTPAVLIDTTITKHPDLIQEQALLASSSGQVKAQVAIELPDLSVRRSASGKFASSLIPSSLPLVGNNYRKILPDEAITASLGAPGLSHSRLDARGSIFCGDHNRFDVANHSANTWLSQNAKRGFWIQWRLGKRYMVTGVTTKGQANTRYYVKRYKLQYTEWEDGLWKDMPTNFLGNIDGNKARYNEIRPGIMASWIRLLPLAWNAYPCLRVEFFGYLVKVNHGIR